MSNPASGRSSTTTTAAPATNPPGPTSPATTSTTSTTSSPAEASTNQPKQAAWKILKNMLPSSGAVQILISLVGLILTILGIKWAVQSYNMARWTEFKDFRDDCRSVQASGMPLSTACGEALRKVLKPPPYVPSSYFSRLVRRDFHAARAKKSIYQAKIEILRLSHICLEVLLRGSKRFLSERSLEITNAVTGVLLRARRKIASVSEHVGTLIETLAIWISRLVSYLTSIARSKIKEIVVVWTYILRHVRKLGSYLPSIALSKLKEMEYILRHVAKLLTFGLLDPPPWPAVFVNAVTAYLVKNRYSRGLNKYPGPFLASLTDWWRFWEVYKRRPEVTHIKLHAKLGDVIRLGPNTLSFAEPAALRTIYG